jgi:DNA-binding LacI/PurR family transcriptional regulator
LLDRDSAVPLYLQVRDALRSEILEGEYQDGDRFHGEADLVQKFGVARGTVRQALDLLEREGFLRRERGRGTFVSGTGIAAGEPAANPLTISFIVPHCRDSFVPTVLLGVEAAARERGAQILFRHVESSPSVQSQALREARAYGVAVVTLNDCLAVRVVRTCRGMGLRVPQDLAVVGFDDTDIAAELEVPLTTVAQPTHQIGFRAAQLLLDKISGLGHGVQRVILPTHLVVRKSSGV